MPKSIGSVMFHSYIYGTALWYTLRGGCRIYDPDMVIGWFRPPVQEHLENTDLERYNVRTDAWCLVTLSGLLVSLTGAVPYASNAISSGATSLTTRLPSRGLASKEYAKVAIMWTMFHHVATAAGSYTHYKHDTHYNKSMGIGVWVNAFLTAAGGATLYYIW